MSDPSVAGLFVRKHMPLVEPVHAEEKSCFDSFLTQNSLPLFVYIGRDLVSPAPFFFTSARNPLDADAPGWPFALLLGDTKMKDICCGDRTWKFSSVQNVCSTHVEISSQPVAFVRRALDVIVVLSALNARIA